MLWHKREELYIKEIKYLQQQLYEKNQFIEQMLKNEQQLLQENFDNNTKMFELFKTFIEKNMH